MRYINSDNYYTTKVEYAARGYSLAHDNLIKPHKDKNRIKEGERNVKDVSLFMMYE